MFRSFYCVFPLHSWVALSSHFFLLSGIDDTLLFLNYSMAGTMQTIYFLKAYMPSTCHWPPTTHLTTPKFTMKRPLLLHPPWNFHGFRFCLFLYQLLSLCLGQESREPMSTGVWKSRWKFCLKVPLCCQKVNEMVIWLLKLCHEKETWNFHLKCCIRSIISIYFG